MPKSRSKILKTIQKYLETPSATEDSQYLNEMLSNMLDLTKTTTDEADLKLVLATLKELRKSIKLFGPYKDSRKVCIFGSARTPETDPNYALADAFALQMSSKGFMIITGAGSGIMEAGNRGALPNSSFGINIDLPFEQNVNKYISQDSKCLTYKYFFTRKLFFIKESDATVLFPGGFGTLDEGFENLTLLQTGHCSPRPVVLIDDVKSTYWKDWLHFISHHLIKDNFISPEDTGLIKHTHSAKEAVAYILHFYSTYHSIKHFSDFSILRLNKPLKKGLIDRLNIDFSDLISDGKFESLKHSSLSVDTDVFLDKPRLLFKFNKVSYSRLIQLISTINDHNK